MAERKERRPRRSGDLTVAGFFLRFAAALVLVFATFNPSGYSVFSWVRRALADSAVGPEHLVVVILLMIGWTVHLVASFRALGALGLTLGALFFAALTWLLIDIGLLKADSLSSVTWIILICIAALLTLGVSGSHIWRRLTGQLEVDDD